VCVCVCVRESTSCIRMCCVFIIFRVCKGDVNSATFRKMSIDVRHSCELHFRRIVNHQNIVLSISFSQCIDVIHLHIYLHLFATFSIFESKVEQAACVSTFIQYTHCLNSLNIKFDYFLQCYGGTSSANLLAT